MSSWIFPLTYGWRSSGGLPLGSIAALLLAAGPAQAHDLAAAEVARLNALVQAALTSGWMGVAALAGSGVALGALHGLEPGHAKTMMSAFIIAIRGTVGQAALLGASATVSHTAVVWLLVVPLLAWGGAVDVSRREPYFQVASAVAVLAVGLFSLVRVLRAQRPAAAAPEAAEALDTGHGLARLTIEHIDGEARFMVRGVARSGRTIPFREDAAVETRRPDGSTETFGFVEREGSLVATAPVPAPHSFVAALRILHGDHGHAFLVGFGGAAAEGGFADAHERAHAEEVRRRLVARGKMSRWQIVLFGLSGGLLPCPAAVTVLLLCLRLQRIWLGLLLVGAFSLGLAMTMIAAGAAAALGTRHLSGRFAGLTGLSRPATYASCMLILAIGLYMLVEGIDALA